MTVNRDGSLFDSVALLDKAEDSQGNVSIIPLNKWYLLQNLPIPYHDVDHNSGAGAELGEMVLIQFSTRDSIRIRTRSDYGKSYVEENTASQSRQTTSFTSGATPSLSVRGGNFRNASWKVRMSDGETPPAIWSIL